MDGCMNRNPKYEKASLLKRLLAIVSFVTWPMAASSPIHLPFTIYITQPRDGPFYGLYLPFHQHFTFPSSPLHFVTLHFKLHSPQVTPLLPHHRPFIASSLFYITLMASLLLLRCSFIASSLNYITKPLMASLLPLYCPFITLN